VALAEGPDPVTSPTGTKLGAIRSRATCLRAGLGIRQRNGVADVECAEAQRYVDPNADSVEPVDAVELYSPSVSRFAQSAWRCSVRGCSAG
jgi:hypothetical protein